MEIEVRANKKQKVVEVIQEEKIVLVLDQEACMFLPALIRVKAMEVWKNS